MLSAHLLVWYN